MSAGEAAGTILERKIPFLVALGTLGAKARDEKLVLALIERMSPTELVTNTGMLEKLGMKSRPVLRAAFEKGLEKAAKSKKNTLKTTRAAETVKDEGLKAKLQNLQEKQIKAGGGVDGDDRDDARGFRVYGVKGGRALMLSLWQGGQQESYGVALCNRAVSARSRQGLETVRVVADGHGESEQFLQGLVGVGEAHRNASRLQADPFR